MNSEAGGGDGGAKRGRGEDGPPSALQRALKKMRGEAAGAPVEAAGARDSAVPAEAAVACDGRDWVSTTATLYHSSDDSTGRAGRLGR